MTQAITSLEIMSFGTFKHFVTMWEPLIANIEKSSEEENNPIDLKLGESLA